MRKRIKQCEAVEVKDDVKYCSLPFGSTMCPEEDYTKCPIRAYAMNQQGGKPLRRKNE